MPRQAGDEGPSRRDDVRRPSDDDKVGAHPFVIGELACGNLRNRDRTLRDLRLFPLAPIADEIDVRHVLETNRLSGMGLGWVDVHILAAADAAGWSILTAYKAMHAAAKRIGIPSIES